MENRTASRKAIILPLIDRIKNANSFNDLENKSTCNSSDNIYFVYNGFGKLYFQHFNNENEVKLIRFTFANH